MLAPEVIPERLMLVLPGLYFKNRGGTWVMVGKSFAGLTVTRKLVLLLEEPSLTVTVTRLVPT